MPEYPVGNTSDNAIIFPYTAIDLTSQIDVLPNQWGLLDELAIFDDVGVDTTAVEINYRNGFINLLSATERGVVPQADGGSDEDAIFFKIPHFPTVDVITPKDLENRWAFVPGEAQPRRRRTLEDELARRLVMIGLKHDLIREYTRMGALKGIVVDGKGKVIVNLFTAFGITQKVVNFQFSNTNFNVQQACFDLKRYIELNLHEDIMTGVLVLVDPVFFNLFIAHPQVVKFWVNWSDAARYRGDMREDFEFGGIKWREYNAQVPTQPLAGVLQQQYNFAEAATNAATNSGSAALTFAQGLIPPEVGAGWGVSDYTNAAGITSGTTVLSQATAIGVTTVTMSANVPGGQTVGSGDSIVFAPPNVNRFIEPNTGYAFPMGTRETFKTYDGPAFTMANIMRVGMKRFVSPKILDHGRGIELFSESNPLPICRKPNLLVKLTTS